VSRKQTNGAYKQYGGTQDFTFKGKAGQLGIYLWYLENYREIPPLMVSGNGFQEQDDQSARAVIEWNFHRRSLHYQLRTGISREKIVFRDRTALLDEKSIGNILQPSALVAWQANSHFRITGEISTLYNSAEVEYYEPDVKTAVQHTLSATMNYMSDKILADVSVRGGIFNSDVLPVTPSMGLLIKNIILPSVRLEAAMMYRNPTLNDLYWRPGGNPDLQAEKGYSLAASLEKAYSVKSLFLRLNTGVFYSEMDRLLTWLPSDNGQYTATNLNGLESKGLELSILGRTCFSDLNFTANVKYQYNLSVLTESNDLYADGINKQMVYTPRHLLKAQAGFTFKNFELRYFHGYTGYRYITQDHSRYLEPFATGELLLSWSGQFRNSGVMLFLNCKNCWDEEYQVIAWRAMPGRYFETGFLIDLKSQKKQRIVN
jgi:iron complex outermembrane receptor protein